MRAIGMTDKGLVREVNQDAFKIINLSNDIVFAVVCDGMGGASCGNIASKIATETICDYIQKSFSPSLRPSAIENMLRSATVSANLAVFRAAKQNAEMNGMGTTAVMVLINKTDGYILHVGDSRAYLLCDDELKQMTVDHSVVQTLVDSGEITAEQAANHPKKNIITRALGVGENVAPDLDFFTFNENNVLLICSDGLTNFVSAEKIKHQLKNIDDDTAGALVALANEGGGGDNITAVVIRA